MKHTLLFITLMIAIMASTIKAQAVTVNIAGGIDNTALQTRMEQNSAKLLSEINAAQRERRNLNFATMGLATDVQRSMSMLWETTPFMCTDDEIVEKCITTPTGYQIRNIPLLMKPLDPNAFNEDEYQEAVISFDKQGNVESFYLSISTNLYVNIIKSNLGLTDLRRRQMILDYVEQFRTAYNKKDLNFIRQIFSDDALIITGKVITQFHTEGYASQKIQYNKQSKQQYITNLNRIFKNARYFKVSFDQIEVMRHPTKTDFYGVTLHQGWTNKSYHDEGYLFLLWDFRDENAPLIHVRTWQPDYIGTKPLPKDEIFNLSDFDL